MTYWCCKEDFGKHEENCINHPKWRFAERVKRLMDKGFTKEEAENVVRTVITTKECTNTSDVSILSSTVVS